MKKKDENTSCFGGSDRRSYPHMDNFCRTTTFHGYHQARFLKYRLSRYLFIVVILGSQYAAISQLVSLTRDFIRNPVSSSVNIINMNLETARNLHLTVCMRNWVSRTRAREHNYTSNDVAAILGVMQAIPEFDNSLTPSVRMMDILKNTTKSELGKIIKQIMKPYPIGEQDGMFRLNNPGHLCLELIPKIQPSFSSAGGMISHFDVPQFLNDTHEVHNSPVTSEGYVQWTMYHLDEGPIPLLLENKLFDLNKNQIMQKVDLKNYVSMLNCIDDSDKLMVPNGYLTRRCNQECVQEHVIKKLYNCFIPPFSDSNVLNVCVLPDIVPGYMRKSFFKYFAEWQDDILDEIAHCISDMGCVTKEVCNTWNIKSTTMKEDRRQVNGDVMHFAFQYAEDIERVETIPIYTWETMISYLGGQWGLWMGASMISFVHMFYSLCETVFEFILEKIQSSKKIKKDPVYEIHAFRGVHKLR